MTPSLLAKGLIYDQPLSFTEREEEWNINHWLEKIQWPMFLYIFEKNMLQSLERGRNKKELIVIF